MRSCRNAEPGIMSNRLWQEQFLMLTGITGVWGMAVWIKELVS